MKKITRKGMIIVALLSFNLITDQANASAYYVNNNGVEMNQIQYEKMTLLYSDRFISYMSQETFDKYKNSSIINNDTIYYKEVSHDNEVIETTEVSKAEFENASTEACGISTYANDDGYYETNYKRLSASLIDGSTFTLLATLTWKKVPVTRSYDVFAFRVMHFNYYAPGGLQTYYTSAGPTYINYNVTSEGYKSLSNGAGFSMNLKDGTNITGYDMLIDIDLNINTSSYSNALAQVSYQHAQSSVTRTQSMGYTLSAGGLGGAILFNDSAIRNKYDEMPGIELVTPI